MISSRVLARLLLAGSCLLMASSYEVAAQTWKPIDPAHLAMKTPVVDKDADAEAIFWEVRVDSGSSRIILAHYVRIKIFTERGKGSNGTVTLPYAGDSKIEEIAARTIRADGTIVDLKSDAIYDRVVVRVSGLKVSAKSFALPGVEPGAIIEYRWRQTVRTKFGYFVRLQFQRDIPVQFVKYYVKPLSDPTVAMRARAFGMPNIPFTAESDKYYSASKTSVPAFREEALMPPEDQVRMWMLLFYHPTVWYGAGEFRKEVYEKYKSAMKVDDEIKKAAAAVLADASTNEQKLNRLYEFCRSRIKNINDDASGMTASDLAKLKENEIPSHTLKRGMGTGFDINLLFGALATAAGFDARVAQLADRSDIFFDPKNASEFLTAYFMSSYNMAVRVDNEWRFFDPAGTYIPFGMLRWQEEGLNAMISDPVQPIYAQTGLSPAEKSLKKRTATLRLSEDGTIEGDVRFEYTGHCDIERKEYNDEYSPEQREQSLRESMKEQMSSAELSNIRVENATDPAKPFTYSFHIRVPGYAQRTGKRLFLQPAFFQKGIKPLFSTSDRTHPIYFSYPWTEKDTVTIQLPDGFALDAADSPGAFNAIGVGEYSVAIAASKDGRILEYKRSLLFGANGNILFQRIAFHELKRIFDEIHERDNHTITLKQTTTGSQE
jgi:uncharacterized protein DUF3857